MSSSLSHGTAALTEPLVATSPAVLTRMEFLSDGAGNYVLSSSLRRDAGFLLSGGNYVFTPGTATNLTMVRTSTGNVRTYT